MSELKPIGPIAAKIVQDLVFRTLARKIHNLGPRVTAEILAETAARHDCEAEVLSMMQSYADLTPEQLAAAGGTDLPPSPLHLVDP